MEVNERSCLVNDRDREYTSTIGCSCTMMIGTNHLWSDLTSFAYDMNKCLVDSPLTHVVPSIPDRT